jgi:hypothetical protein
MVLFDAEPLTGVQSAEPLFEKGKIGIGQGAFVHNQVSGFP